MSDQRCHPRTGVPHGMPDPNADQTKVYIVKKDVTLSDLGKSEDIPAGVAMSH